MDGPLRVLGRQLEGREVAFPVVQLASMAAEVAAELAGAESSLEAAVHHTD